MPSLPARTHASPTPPTLRALSSTSRTSPSSHPYRHLSAATSWSEISAVCTSPRAYRVATFPISRLLATKRMKDKECHNRIWNAGGTIQGARDSMRATQPRPPLPPRSLLLHTRPQRIQFFLLRVSGCIEGLAVSFSHFLNESKIESLFSKKYNGVIRWLLLVALQLLILQC